MFGHLFGQITPEKDTGNYLGKGVTESKDVEK